MDLLCPKTLGKHRHAKLLKMRCHKLPNECPGRNLRANSVMTFPPKMHLICGECALTTRFETTTQGVLLHNLQQVLLRFFQSHIFHTAHHKISGCDILLFGPIRVPIICKYPSKYLPFLWRQSSHQKIPPFIAESHRVTNCEARWAGRILSTGWGLFVD